MPDVKLTPVLEHLVTLDKRLVEASKKIKILTSLEWSSNHADEFLAAWEAGKPKLPNVTYPKVDYKKEIHELHAIMKECDRSHAVGSYIYLTAESYLTAAQ